MLELYQLFYLDLNYPGLLISTTTNFESILASHYHGGHHG
jgi:hypothetical protein